MTRRQRISNRDLTTLEHKAYITTKSKIQSHKYVLKTSSAVTSLTVSTLPIESRAALRDSFKQIDRDKAQESRLKKSLLSRVAAGAKVLIGQVLRATLKVFESLQTVEEWRATNKDTRF